MARPTKIDERLIAQFCHELRTGSSIEDALVTCDISRESYQRWKRRVKDHKGTKLENRLVHDSKIALIEFKRIAEKKIFLAGQKSWPALAWILQRRYPKEYGNKRLWSTDDEPETPVAYVRWITPEEEALSNAAPTPSTSSTDPGPPSEPSTP